MNKSVESIFLIFLPFIMYFISYYINSLMSNHLSVEAYGEFYFGLKILYLVSGLATLGTVTTIKKYLTTYFKDADINSEKIKNYIHWNLKFLSAPLLILCLIGLGAFIPPLKLHYLGIKDINSFHIALYMLWLAPFFTIGLISSNFLYCANKPILAFIFSQHFRKVALLASVVFFIYVLKSKITEDIVVSIIGFHVFFFLISSLSVCIWYIKQTRNLSLRTIISINAFSDEYPYKNTALSLMLNSLVYNIVVTLDIIFLKLLCNDKKQLAIYSVCLTIAGFVWLVVNPFFVKTTPKIYQYLNEKGGKEKLNSEMRYNSLKTLATGIIVSIVIIMFSDQILSSFGKEYDSYHSILYLTCLAGIFGIISKPYTLLIAYSEYSSELFKTALAEFLIMLIFGAGVVAYFGAIGAAVMVIFCTFSRLVLAMKIAKKVMEYKPFVIF